MDALYVVVWIVAAGLLLALVFRLLMQQGELRRQDADDRARWEGEGGRTANAEA